MKSTKSILSMLWGAGAMILLILDAKTALHGASEGIDLCLRTVIPALFPFLVCSGYLVGNAGHLSMPAFRLLGQICRIPEGSENVLMVGLLGGYPVGAQAISSAYQNGTLSKEDARRMLGFCNNAGPAFLFGILPSLYSDAKIPWIIWLIHLLSAIGVGIILPGETGNKIPRLSGQGVTLSEALAQAVRSMALICGWVVIFRTVLVFLNRWIMWYFPETLAVLFSGLMELTNGCLNLGSIANEVTRFWMASLFLSLGGCCVGMQTVSVTGSLGLGAYFPGKLLQTGISCFLSALALPWLYPGALWQPWLLVSILWCVTMAFALYFPKITVAFSGGKVYNKEKLTK